MPVAVSCGVVPEGAATPAHGARAGLTSKLRLVNSRTGKVHAATVVHPDDKAGPAWINPAKKDMQGAPDPGIIFLEVDVAGMTPSFGTSEDTGGHENRYELVYTIGGGCGGVSVSMPLEVRLSDMPLPTREPLLQAIAGAVPGQIVKVPLQSASAAGQGAAGAAPSLSLRMAEELPGRTA